MFVQNNKFKLPAILAGLLFLLAGTSTVLADQVTLTYVDANSNAQTLTVDANSSAEDLALAASLVGENGVGISHDPDSGSGSMADIAAAMAAAEGARTRVAAPRTAGRPPAVTAAAEVQRTPAIA